MHQKLSIPAIAILAISVLPPQSSLCAATWIPIYDARVDTVAQEPSKAEVESIKKLVMPRAKKFWIEEPEFDLRASARGSFTRKGAAQKIYLYQFSTQGHNMASDGLAVVEGGKLCSHYAYRGGWESRILALPDLNGDNLNELAIEGGFFNMGESAGSIYILTFSPKLRNLGRIDVAHGIDLPNKKESVCYRVLAQPGKTIKFKAEKFREKGKRWLPEGSTAVVPEDAYKFVDLNTDVDQAVLDE